MINQSAINPRVFDGFETVQIVIKALQIFLVSILCALCVHTADAQQQSKSPSVDWLTGKELEKASLLAVSGDFQGAPLRQRLMQFAKRQRIGIFVDRRVDPMIELNMSFVDLTVEQFLWKLADQCELGICQVGDVFYVGPRETAKTLPILLLQLHEETAKLRRLKDDGPKWNRKSELSWPQLTEPRALIDNLVVANGINLTNPELIPHDLWPATELPELSLDQQFALLIVGFDLWFVRSSQGQTALTQLPAIEEGVCTVNNVEDAKQVARSLRAEIEGGKFTGSGRTIKMAGSVETLFDARRWLINQQKSDGGLPSEHRFTINTTAKRQSILDSIVRQLNYQLSYPPTANEALREMVTIKMDEKPVDAIIAEVLKGTQLTFQIQGSRLVIK